jgi:hypothetical protein
MFESDVQFADTAVGGPTGASPALSPPHALRLGHLRSLAARMDFPMFFTASQVNVLGSEDREPRQAKPPKLCTTLNIKIQMEARSSQTSVSWSGRMAVPAPLSPDRGLVTRIGRRLTRSEGRGQLIRAP